MDALVGNREAYGTRTPVLIARWEADAIQGSFDHHTRTVTEAGEAYWSVSDHHGWFVYGPKTPVDDGIYRIRVWARVEGPPDARSYFDVTDWGAEGRIYGAEMFRDGLEMCVRLYQSPSLQFRFRTEGERLRVDAVEMERLLADHEVASPDELRALIHELVESRAEPPAVFHALNRLAAWGHAAEAEERRALFIAGRQSRDVEIVSRLLRLQAPLGAPPERVARNPQALSRERIRQVQESQPISSADWFQLTPELRARLRTLGYDAVNFTATRLHRDYSEPSRRWHERPKSGVTGVYAPRQPLLERDPDIDLSHQASLAQGLGMAGYCPVSGEALRSRHGFLVCHESLPFLFYRFEGVEVFYVCTGGRGGQKMFVYTPRTRLVTWIIDPPFQGFPADELVRLLEEHLVTFADEVGAYLRGDTRPAAVIGNDSYGHFLWMTLSGLQYAYESGLMRLLAGVVKVPTEYVPSLEIFPELAELPWRAISDGSEAFRHCVVSGYVPIHFTDGAITDALADRVLEISRERALSRPPEDVPRPLIWLNLRNHNKRWLSQVEGFANILNSLYENYGALSVRVDGMPDCAELLVELRPRVRPEIKLFDGLNASFYDKMVWGAAVDGHITVVGAGLTLIHSLASAPGVAHGNPEHLRQMTFWDSMRPGSGTPLHVTEDQVTELSEGLQCDYELDWRILRDLTRKVLDPKFPRSSATVAPPLERVGLVNRLRNVLNR